MINEGNFSAVLPLIIKVCVSNLLLILSMLVNEEVILSLLFSPGPTCSHKGFLNL